jgi:hypothetical protein
MAKIVKEFPAQVRRRESKYPWDQWLDGQVWELAQGVDFQTDANAMRSVVYLAAKRVGVKVRVGVDKGNGLMWVEATEVVPQGGRKKKAKK